MEMRIVVLLLILSLVFGKKRRRQRKRKFSVDDYDTPQYTHDQIHLITCTTCHCLIRKIVRLRRTIPKGAPYKPYICNYIHGPDKHKEKCQMFLEEYGDWLSYHITQGTTAYTICKRLGACTDDIMNVEVKGGKADNIHGSNVEKIFGHQCKVDDQLMLDWYKFFHKVADENPRATHQHAGTFKKPVSDDHDAETKARIEASRKDVPYVPSDEKEKEESTEATLDTNLDDILATSTFVDSEIDDEIDDGFFDDDDDDDDGDDGDL